MARFAPKNTLPALGGLLGAALLIGYAPAAAEGAMRGLSACGRIILPAVFPFLAVSVFLAGAPGGAGVNDMPVAYQSRAPEYPQAFVSEAD